MRRAYSLLGILAAVCACLSAGPARGQNREVRVTDRNELLAAMRHAGPGTTIRVAAGTYRGGISHERLQGTQQRPIVITAENSEEPPIFHGGGNAFHLSDPAYVELSHLVLDGCTGNGLNIDDGGSKETPAHHVTLSHIVCRDIGPGGNRDGFKLSGLDNFRVEHCTIERWGDGGSGIDMVGCHDGVIEHCVFHKARGDGANAVQAKGGSRNVTVRRCRFDRAGGRGVNAGGSTGLQFFRPDVLGYEAKDITVEDCTFSHMMAAVAYVGVDGAVVQHNTIYAPQRWVIRILQENTDSRMVPSRNGRFVKNLVVFDSNALNTVVNVGPQTAPDTFRFEGNAWYCSDRPGESQRRIRLPVAETGGLYGVDPELADAAGGDLTIGARDAVNGAGVRPSN